MNVVDSSGWLEYFADGPNATARVHGAMLWTQDDDFAGMPGVRYIPKPKG